MGKTAVVILSILISVIFLSGSIQASSNSRSDDSTGITPVYLSNRNITLLPKVGIRFAENVNYALNSGLYLSAALNFPMGRNWVLETEVSYCGTDYQIYNEQGNISFLGFAILAGKNFGNAKYNSRFSFGIGTVKVESSSRFSSAVVNPIMLYLNYDLTFKLDRFTNLTLFLKKEFSGNQTFRKASTIPNYGPWLLGLGMEFDI